MARNTFRITKASGSVSESPATPQNLKRLVMINSLAKPKDKFMVEELDSKGKILGVRISLEGDFGTINKDAEIATLKQKLADLQAITNAGPELSETDDVELKYDKPGPAKKKR